MLCQVCLRSEAMIRVLDWPPDNPQVESHYCAACYERVYSAGPIGRVVEDDVPPPFFSRPRFTIRHLMIMAGLSGLLDAFLVLFIRLCVRGTPAEIGEWTMRAVLFGNAFCAASIAMILAFGWLARWHRYATTGRWLTSSQMMGEAGLLQRVGTSTYLDRAFEDEVERALLGAFLWAHRWYRYGTTGRWLTREELIPESWQREGVQIPTHPRLASAGEWFFLALILVWLSLWGYGLGPDGLSVWVASWVPRYGIEAIFVYILILPAGELLAYLGLVAAAVRRRDRERSEAGLARPPAAGDNPRGSDSGKNRERSSPTLHS